MPITQFLERNAAQWPNDVALVELNPDIKVPRLTTWKEFELIQPLNEVASRSHGLFLMKKPTAWPTC